MTVRVSSLLKTLICEQKLFCYRYPRPILQIVRTNIHYAKEPYKAKYVSLDAQSLQLPGKERVRASKLTDDPSKYEYEVPNAPYIKTVYDVLDHGLKTSNDGDCIGSKSPATGKYEWFKYSEVILKSQYVGSGLMYLGINPGSDSHVGVFATNRQEFLLSLYGCSGYSMVFVPLYGTLNLQSIVFIIKQVGFPLVVVNNEKNALHILNNASEFPSLHTLILMDEPTSEVTELSRRKGLKILSFSDLEELGKRNMKSLVLPDPDDLFCIPYTSGTTGTPKGAMVTHKNIMSCVTSLVIGYGKAGVYGGTIISYLPPAHIYEIMNEIASMYFARRVAFYNGDVKLLMDEVKALNPTIVPLVPRIMNAIYAKSFENMKDNAFKKFLLKFALTRKEKLLKRGIITKKSIWDKLVFKEFQEVFGANAHIISTTSAPVSAEIMRFFRCASGAHVFEAYGQTEVLAATMTLPNEIEGGTVGPPLPCNHVKLCDVPEMGYLAKDDIGEICFKGVNVFKGYYKNPEATKESIDEEGWHHSGDIGKWMPNGTLKIVDRRKHLFKLSQGEYIAPEKVENAYSHSNEVLQIYVDGFTDKDYIIALVVPEMINLKKWLERKGYKSENLLELLQNKDVKRDFVLELHKLGKDADLNPLEQVRNVHFLSEPFSIQNDLLTPTFKVRRNNARKHFEPLFQKLYEEGPLVKSITHQ